MKEMKRIQIKQNDIIGKQNEKIETIVKQHVEIVTAIKSLSQVQSDIAQQVLSQHAETQELYKALGLKKDLSYYSYNLQNEEGH